jgi:glycyl-tRNA synthetase
VSGGNHEPVGFAPSPPCHRTPGVHVLSPDRIEQIVGLAKRRGFGYPSAEIYHGTDPFGTGVELFTAAWDYGPLGVEMRENVKRQWWKACVQGRDDVVGMDSAVIAAPALWRASGRDPTRAAELTQCQVCRQQVRMAQLPAAAQGVGLADIPCPHCGNIGTLAQPAMLDSTLRTRLYRPDGEPSVHFLRPDPIQGILVNFANVMRSARRRPPFGIGQIGRSFRNGIEPGNPMFRTHEFEEMGLAYFVRPGTDDQWRGHWVDARWDWYLDLGLPEAELRRVDRVVDPRSGAVRNVDIDFRFGFADDPWGRLEAVVNRGDVDLLAHSRASGTELTCYDQPSDTRWTPYVICPTAGLSRCVLAFLVSALAEDFAAAADGVARPRTVLRLDHRLAPVKVAVLPLSRNAELSPLARNIAAGLRCNWNVEFDDAGAIGRRYRRQDEIGTPFCVTLDFVGAQDQSVTVRERDTMKQDRVSLDRLAAYLSERLVGC